MKRAVLVGHSGSGLVLRRVALDTPGRASGLVLGGSPTSMVEHPAFAEFVREVAARLKDPLNPAFIARFVLNGTASAPEQLAADTEAAEIAKVPAHVWQAPFGAMTDHDDRRELPEIGCPVLLAWGERDPLVDRQVQQQLALSLHAATPSVYPGVGHTPRFAAPERFARELADVAARCTTGTVTPPP